MFHANGYLNHLISLIALGLFISTAHAANNDKQQPIYIVSDSLTFDESKGVSYYEGNVKFSQGSLIIEADYVKIILKNNALNKMIIKGQPAHLNQLQKDQLPVTATANRIEYLPNTDIIKLYGNALVQQGQQNINGEFIQYNRRTSQINANGNKDKKDRVNITIMPKRESTPQ